MAVAGAWACQRDSYLKEIKTKVKSCEAASLSIVSNGKKQKVAGFQVTLDDTVLFPEGGGQPDDRGTQVRPDAFEEAVSKVGGVGVLRVSRNVGEAVHFLPAPLECGADVEVRVDWNRRFDHMQQHTGQHLITAVADSMFGFSTTSWNLGEKTSFIELNTPSMSRDQMENLEVAINEKIRACVPVLPTVFESKDDPTLKQFRTLGLPDDHVGPVRMIAIQDVDTTLCCGTHVSNLSHLQAIKLLGLEKGKKGKVNLVFVAGQRVLNYLGNCYENEKALTGVLKKEGDNEYMNIVVNEVGDPNVLIFITTGDDKGAGLFMLAGPEETVAQLGPKVAELLEGKGAGKKGRFQGKGSKLQRRHLVVNLLQDRIASIGS